MTSSEPQSDPSNQQEPAALPRVITSTELFDGARVVVIDHAGQQYRLFITRNDRLILQK